MSISGNSIRKWRQLEKICSLPFFYYFEISKNTLNSNFSKSETDPIEMYKQDSQQISDQSVK